MTTTMKQELGPYQKKWLEALRSGKYQQGKSHLRSEHIDGDKFCCLGVACEILNVPLFVAYGCFSYGNQSQVAPAVVVSNLGLYGVSGDHADDRRKETRLTHLNDNGKTFADIADIIEANPASYFREPK